MITTFTLVQEYFDRLERQYKQYRQRRQTSFILLGLTYLVSTFSTHTHATLFIGLGFVLCGSSLYLFLTAEKLLNSILEALCTDVLKSSPVKMNGEECVRYLQIKTTLSFKVFKAVDNLF